jgi:hypothetical protein
VSRRIGTVMAPCATSLNFPIARHAFRHPRPPLFLIALRKKPLGATLRTCLLGDESSMGLFETLQKMLKEQ